MQAYASRAVLSVGGNHDEGKVAKTKGLPKPRLFAFFRESKAAYHGFASGTTVFERDRKSVV